MSKILRRTLKVLAIVLAAVIILLVTAAILLNTDTVQNWLMQRAVGALKEELQTEVRIGHISVSMLKGRLSLKDVEIEDRQQRKMLQMDKLAVALDISALLNHEVVVTKTDISGLKATLCKPASPTDSTANYQFLVEVLKSHKAPKPNETQKPDEDKKLPIVFRINSATIGIDSLCYKTDNGQPRRNTDKPHRGAFDAGHLDVCAALTLKLEHITNNGLYAILSDFRAIDRGSGLQVDTLQLQANITKDSIWLNNVEIRLPHTRLSFAEGQVVLPDTTAGRSLSYHVPKLNATTQLRDIAQPFAPVLKDFTTPLWLLCTLNGENDTMRFDSVNVNTKDRQLLINASGNISHLKGKRKWHVHFDVQKMTTNPATVERIIYQFPVKKFMMKQLRALGRINYNGHFDIVYKKESFAGRLNTKEGSINFQFALDENNKYLNGTVKTSALKLGNVMDMPRLGNIACSADFRFDISKPRTAIARKQRGGKLPIGNIEAHVQEAHYGIITVHNVFASIVSDGAEATGSVINHGKHIDISCKFSFTNTDQMHKLKVKPGLKLHGKKKKETNETKKK